MNRARPDADATDPEEVLLDLAGRRHDGDGPGGPPHVYLGLAIEEYAAWVEGKLTDEDLVARMAARRQQEARRGVPEGGAG